ncbi:MAG TPA: TldD/PmbA family protein [Myxococcota bacterium]
MTTTITAVPTLEWARELAESLVDAAQKAGADACDATVGTGSALSASAREGAVEDVTRATSRTAGLRVVVGGRLGFATSADAPTDPASVAALVKSAIALARVSTASADNVIPRAAPLGGADLAAAAHALGTWDDATADAPPAWAIEEALLMERLLRETPGITALRDVSAGARRGVFALATSTGFSGAYRGTSCSLSCSAVVDDGDKKQSEGYFASSRSVRALAPAESVAREAARRALARRGARKLETMRVPVIFDPSMARGFFAAILNALCGDSLAKKQSFLAGKKGQQVLAPGIAVVDDPALSGGFASRPFDGEGLLTPKLHIIDERGAITTYLHDARSAARLGETTTGHASRGAASLPSPSPTNTTIAGGQGDLQSIIGDTKRGLLVTRLLGRGPDMVTGDYSRGAAGFFVDGGELAFPVEEITIGGKMSEMMLAIDRVGADLDERSSLRAPTIRFAELQVSGR